MIERANATIKELIGKSVEINQKLNWVKILDKLIDNINNSKHRITGFTRNEIQNVFNNNNKDVLEVVDKPAAKKSKQVQHTVMHTFESFDYL